MNKVLVTLIAATLLAACSREKAPEPAGEAPAKQPVKAAEAPAPTAAANEGANALEVAQAPTAIASSAPPPPAAKPPPPPPKKGH